MWTSSFVNGIGAYSCQREPASRQSSACTIVIGEDELVVGLYPVERKVKAQGFKTVHRKCGTAISKLDYCSKCNCELKDGETQKQFKSPQGKPVKLDKQQVEQLSVESDDRVIVHPDSVVTTIGVATIEKSYYLAVKLSKRKTPSDADLNAQALYDELNSVLAPADGDGALSLVSKLVVKGKTVPVAITSDGEGLFIHYLHHPRTLAKRPETAKANSKPASMRPHIANLRLDRNVVDGRKIRSSFLEKRDRVAAAE